MNLSAGSGSLWLPQRCRGRAVAPVACIRTDAGSHVHGAQCTAHSSPAAGHRWPATRDSWQSQSCFADGQRRSRRRDKLESEGDVK